MFSQKLQKIKIKSMIGSIDLEYLYKSVGGGLEF